MSTSKIGWTDATWNPVTGCTPCSEGCAHCYAARMAKRLAGRFGYPEGDGFAVAVHPGDRFTAPLRWSKPRRVFVCSMGDLFHEDVPYEAIAAVWDVMGDCPQHQFQVLTKRPARMLEIVRALNLSAAPHVWLGVTAENQQRADERIPLLLQMPDAVRFVSVEPMLGPVDLAAYVGRYHCGGCVGDPGGDPDCPGHDDLLDWVICGAETGPGARPMATGWATDLEDQCNAAGVPFFFKQWGSAPAGPRPVAPMRRQFPEVPR